MLIRVLDTNMKRIGKIIAKNVKIEKSLDMCEQKISFSTMDYVENEYYIDTTRDIFVVKENTKGQNGYRNIVAELNLDGLKGTHFELFQTNPGGMTIGDCVDLALTGTGWHCGDNNITGMDDRKREITMSNVSAYDVIKKICVVYNCEVSWLSYQNRMFVSPKVGSDRGLHFMTGLNVKEFNCSIESYEYYTRIIPIGKDGLDIKSVNGGKNYLENFQHTSKVKTLLWEDTNYTDPTALMEDAKYKLNELSKPKKSISIKVIDLSALSKGSYFEYKIGDIVTVVDGESQTREKMRIVKTVEYTDDPMKNTCELASTILSFEEMQKRLFEAANSVNNITNGNIVIGGKVQGMKASQIEGLYDDFHGGNGFSKLPDGTMIQWGMVRENITTNAYKNAVKNIAFPYLFAVGYPVTVTIQNENNTYSMITLVDTIEYGSCRVILQGAAAANASTATWFRWMAIGRWK